MDRFVHSVIRLIDGMGLCRYMWKQFGDYQWDKTSKGNTT